MTARERGALTLWGSIVAGLTILDIAEREKHTMSEAHRALRRRHPVAWALGWISFAFWFLVHVFGGDDSWQS